MKKNHELLLNVLRKQNKPISSTKLAELLSVSSRSVKNYVNEINADASEYDFGMQTGVYV